MKLISGHSHMKLSLGIAKELQTELVSVGLGRFSNGEVRCRIDESIRGEDVFIIQSHATNVNESIIEQAILIDAARRASARTITAVCPFMAYARQDRKAGGREPISARLVVDMLVNAGADRMVSVDLHTSQIQGFTNKPFDHIVARPTLVDALNLEIDDISNSVVVAPDAGRAKSAESYAKMLGVEVAIVHKVRDINGRLDAKQLIGEVEGKSCIVVDDMIDTAGTICAAASILTQHGATAVYGAITHGVFSGDAVKRIENSDFTKILVTDTLPIGSTNSKIKVISFATVLANSISEIAGGGSVSGLFNGSNQH